MWTEKNGTSLRLSLLPSLPPSLLLWRDVRGVITEIEGRV